MAQAGFNEGELVVLSLEAVPGRRPQPAVSRGLMQACHASGVTLLLQRPLRASLADPPGQVPAHARMSHILWSNALSDARSGSRLGAKPSCRGGTWAFRVRSATPQTDIVHSGASLLPCRRRARSQVQAAGSAARACAGVWTETMWRLCSRASAAPSSTLRAR